MHSLITRIYIIDTAHIPCHIVCEFTNERKLKLYHEIINTT